MDPTARFQENLRRLAMIDDGFIEGRARLGLALDTALALDSKTADHLARSYRSFGAQYPIFAEVSDASNATINQYLDTADAVDQIHDPALRSDAAGTLQSLIGLWQIFCRQASIAPADSGSRRSKPEWRRTVCMPDFW